TVLQDSLAQPALAQLFTHARTRNAWLDRPVADATLRQLYDLVKWGPTTANTTPARFVFIRSPEAKDRLRPHLSPGNVDKTLSAPCCVIVAYVARLYELIPKLLPSRDMSDMFAGKDELIFETAMRNSTLQGGYLIMAARAL